MLLSEVKNNLIAIDEKYRISFIRTDFLIVEMAIHWNHRLFGFSHPNMLSSKPKMLEYKHHRYNGSKFWTRIPGQTFSFIIPANQIDILPEKGYSYVHCLINGQKTFLNVSGGTHEGGWTDFVSGSCTLGSNMGVKKIKKIAEISIPPQDSNISEEALKIIASPDEPVDRHWKEEVAKRICLPSLKEGDKVILDPFYSSNFEISFLYKAPRNTIVIKDGGYPRRFTLNAILWELTAKANGIKIPTIQEVKRDIVSI